MYGMITGDEFIKIMSVLFLVAMAYAFVEDFYGGDDFDL